MTDLNALFYDPVPTPAEKALYDQFVEQYMVDFNAFEACMRVGFGASYALEYAKIFLLKPYIIRKIAEKRNTAAADPQKQEDQDKALVLSVARELAQNGKGAQRVAGAALLARIRGMDVQPDKTGDALKQLADDFKDLAKNLPD